MARLTLGDQVSIVSTGEKGTIVGESNGLYDVRIGGAGTMETRRGVRRRDLERFVPEFSSPFNGMVQVNIPGVTGVPMSTAQQANFDDMLRASGAQIITLDPEQLAAVERESARTWAEMEQNPDGALACDDDQ